MSGLFHLIGCIFSQDARDNWRMEHDGTVDANIKLDTNIRPDLGKDERTSSGYVEKSEPMKPKDRR